MLPSYQNPITISPSLPTQLANCCNLLHKQQKINDAVLNTTNRLWVEPYRYNHTIAHGSNSIESKGVDYIERIVLEFTGHISGIQYDRFGAVWVNDIELLRTTTPEPSGMHNVDGSEETIKWSVTKDVTDYASALLLLDSREEEMYAAISIPNMVNKEYTGVIYVNCSLAFYTSKQQQEYTAMKNRRLSSIMNLNPSIHKHIQPNITAASLWSQLSTKTNTLQNHTITRNDLPLSIRQSEQLGNGIYLDVYASGHGCEEFYYTNLPTPISPSQQCGGGPIRLLQVSINNQIVGMIVPYPTVYTGGINPMLWRPLTGIESFNVVPYRFDLSPFMGLFHDLLLGKGNATIDIGLQVVTGESIGSSSIEQETLTHEGVWSLDSTLIFYPDHSDNKAVVSPMYDTLSTTTSHSQPQTTIQLINNSSGYNVTLTNLFTLLASSTRNTKQTLNITYEIDTFVTLLPYGDDVLFMDEGRSISYGKSRQRITTTTSTQGSEHHDSKDDKIWLKRVSTSQYSIFTNTTDRQDGSTFDLSANISWSRQRYETYTSSTISDSTMPSVYWMNTIDALGRYNRSLTNHTDIHNAENESNETFIVKDNTSSRECYNAQATAVNGSIIDNNGHINGKSLVFDFNCTTLPSDILFCGQELCGLLDFESNFWMNVATKSRSNTNRKSTHHHVRHAIWSFVLVSAVLLVVVKGKVFTFLLSLYNNKFKRSGPSSIEQMPPLLNTALLSDEGNGRHS